MDFDSVFQNICSQIASMNRQQIKEGILHFQGRIKLDFPEAYLDTLDLIGVLVEVIELTPFEQ